MRQIAVYVGESVRWGKDILRVALPLDSTSGGLTAAPAWQGPSQGAFTGGLCLA